MGRAALAGTLTPQSAGEQASAGLDRLTQEEIGEFNRLNAAYREKFGFPFVMAVKHRSTREILDALQARLAGTREAEFERSIAEIETIARLRLAALFGES